MVGGRSSPNGDSAVRPFELLDAALDQLGLARLVTEAADESLHMLDFVALLFVSGQSA